MAGAILHITRETYSGTRTEIYGVPAGWQPTLEMLSRQWLVLPTAEKVMP